MVRVAESLSVAEVYESHFEFVWCALRRLGVRATLEDAVQDVFVVVARRLAEFEHRSSIKTWLFGIALRVAKVHRRRGARSGSEVEVNDERLVGTHVDPQQAAVETQAAAIVQGLLDQLTEERRVIYVMAELEDFSAPEIAETLGITLNTVYSRLRLARRDFEGALRRLRAQQAWRQP